MQSVLLIEALALHRRNFLGDFAAQTQEKFHAVLDQLLCLCMEKLESTLEDPATKARFPNCFGFLCLAQSHFGQQLPAEQQARTQDFFRTRIVKLLPSHDIALGLSTIDQFGSEFNLSDLVKVASQPTSAVPYAAKVELTSYLLDKPIALDELEAWLLSTLQNLMLAPELNTPAGSAWTPGKLEALLAKILVAPGTPLILTSNLRSRKVSPGGLCLVCRGLLSEHRTFLGPTCRYKYSYATTGRSCGSSVPRGSDGAKASQL